MEAKLDELIEQGKKLKPGGFFYGCDDFWSWHENCIEFLECIPLSFREQVTSPFDVHKGVEWLQETFRRHDGGDDENRQ